MSAEGSFPWTALAYPAAGAAAGAFVGFVVASPSRAFATAAPWLLGVLAVAAVGVGSYAGLKAFSRRRPRALAGGVVEPARERLAVAIELPSLEPGFPDVFGAGESFEVLGRAAPGAKLALSTDPACRVEPLGGGRFRVEAPEGRVVLVARASHAGAEAEARREVKIVRYEREIRTMVDDFRAWAEVHVPEARSALTTRELMDAVAPRVRGAGEKALLSLARAYEIVTYGERPADRALYAEVVRAFAALEDGGLFEAAEAPEAR